MSKKLIAVAAAAALALTGLVGVAPATAAMPYADTGTQPVATNSLLITSTTSRVGTGGTGTLASPYTINVPDSGLATSLTTVRFSISTTAARAITVSTTSGIKVVAAVTNTTPVVLTGADSLTVTTNASGAAEFFAYPTSTTRGVVTITNDGDITQIYITGNEGLAYDIGAVTLPVFELEKAGVIVAVVTDPFGNPVATVSNQTLTVTRVGTGSPTSTDIVYSATSKRWQGTVTPGKTAGTLAISMVVAGLSATDPQKAAFGEPNSTYFGIVQVGSTKTTAMLSAEIAALQTQLLATTTKANYNKLAKRWNKKNPNNKVKLLK
jgi:hypothetical protein